MTIKTNLSITITRNYRNTESYDMYEYIDGYSASVVNENDRVTVVENNVLIFYFFVF